MAKLGLQNRGHFRKPAYCLAVACLVATALLTVRVSAPTFEDCQLGHSSVQPSTSHPRKASFCSLSQVDFAPPFSVFRILAVDVGVARVTGIPALYPAAAHKGVFYNRPPPQ